jgi:hypothetical protein
MTQSREEKMWDVRTLERKLRKGIINRKDYEKYLKSLPDRAENAAPVETDGDDDEDGDEE